MLHAGAGELFYAGLTEMTPLRFNLSLFSLPAAAAINLSAGWRLRCVVDAGPAAYSALAVLAAPPPAPPAPATADLGLLYERANVADLPACGMGTLLAVAVLDDHIGDGLLTLEQACVQPQRRRYTA